MTGCVCEMQIQYCYAPNISWALQAWEKLNVLWLSQCLAPLLYYLHLISHICSHKRQNKTVTRKIQEKNGMFPIDSGLIQTLPVLFYSGSSAWQTLYSRAQGTVGFTRKRRNKRHPPTGTVNYPWQEWRWHPAHSSSKEIQPRCLDSKAGAPKSLQIPCAAPGDPSLQTLPQSCQLKKQVEHAGCWTPLYLPGHFQRQGYSGSLPKPLQFQCPLHY